MKLKSASSVLLIRLPLKKVAIFAILVAGFLFIGAILPVSVQGEETAVEIAEAVSEKTATEKLQEKIAGQNAKIAALEKEIAAYEIQLVGIGTQKKTLENEVKQLDISRKKIGANISVTQDKIEQATLQLEELGGAIDDKEKKIETGSATILKSFRYIYQAGDSTLVEYLFTSSGLVEAWEEIDKQRILQMALQEEVKTLLANKESLTLDLNATQKKQIQLKSLRRDLAGQKQVLDQNRKDQAKLLADTKNKESTYQSILVEKQQAKLEFEKELSEYEAALHYTLDPSTVPAAGSGVLSFPLDFSYMARCKDRKSVFGNVYCITQYFGNTAFAQSGAYNGKGHNGVDFGTPSGTKVVTALTGVVLATGNTDAYAGCYSYGKWVLVKHANGLATLYAHLSIISVAKGDAVATGGIIGYSGKTGYATGPHLHFTVYASDAVKIIRLGDLKAKTNCANALVPVAATGAYLNPMSYL